MIRPFTCICMLLAAGSGLYLYQTKHRAQLLDREISRTFKQIDLTRDRIGVLKAEWALLNEPDRLNELAQQHTSLRSLAPTQFVALGDLGNHLPAPAPPGSTLPAEDPAPTQAPAPAAAAKPALPGAKIIASSDKPATDKPAADKPAALHAASRPTAASPSAGSPATPSPPIALSALQPPSQPLPRPVPPAASRILAPVVNISAGALQSTQTQAAQTQSEAQAQAQAQALALAPGTVGAAVARAERLRAGNRTLTATISPTQAPPTQAQAAPTYAAQSWSGTALSGGGRAALPPPVPFGASAPGR